MIELKVNRSPGAMMIHRKGASSYVNCIFPVFGLIHGMLSRAEDIMEKYKKDNLEDLFILSDQVEVYE